MENGKTGYFTPADVAPYIDIKRSPGQGKEKMTRKGTVIPHREISLSVTLYPRQVTGVNGTSTLDIDNFATLINSNGWCW